MRKALLLLPFSLALFSCSEIRSEEVGVKRTFGKIDPEELSPGLHFYLPIVQSINKVPVVVRNYEMRDKDAITALSKDGLEIKVDVSVLYRLKPDKVAELVQRYGLKYEDQIIRPVIRTVVRDAVAGFQSSQVYSERSKVAELIRKTLAERLPKEYVIVEDVLVRNIKLPPKVVQAIEEKRKALEEAQKMKYVLEKEKLEAQRKIVEAQGIAKANRIIADSLKDRYIQWYFIQSLKEYAKGDNNSVIVIPYDLKMSPIINLPGRERR